MQTIQALVVTRPGELAVESRPLSTRETGEALVAPIRVGICGTDYHIFEGNQPFLSYPRVMGHELAVRVIEAPAGAAVVAGDVCVVNPYLSCGDCVACRKGKPNCCTKIAVLGVHRDGGMAAQLALPVGNLIPAPGFSADECAMVEFLAIGAHAVHRAAVVADDRALVVGAGPIGLGVALFAALSGADVTIADREPQRLAAAERLVPNIRTQIAGDDAAARFAEITSGDGFDAVFDATGSRASIEAGFQHVAHGGRYTLVSIVKGEINFVDADFHRKEVTLLGSRNALRQDFEQVMQAIRAGQVRAEDWITHRTTLSRAVDDLPRWARDKSGLIKAVIEID